MRNASILALLSCFFAGCLSPSDPLPVRLFTPPIAVPKPIARSGAAIYLAPVGAAGLVESRFAWRLSEVELGYDDLHRWADHPRAFVTSALRAEWFGSGAFEELAVAAGEAWEVVVDIEQFEVARSGNQGTALVALRVRAVRGSVREELVVARASGEGDPGDLARAMGQALAEAARKSREWLAGIEAR